MEDGKKEIAELLGNSGVFLIPTYPTPAGKHGKVYKKIFSLFKGFRSVLPYITLANTFGLPAVVVPCGRSRNGLPIGLQVVSTVGNEEILFRVAAFLESNLEGYQRNTFY